MRMSGGSSLAMRTATPTTVVTLVCLIFLALTATASASGSRVYTPTSSGAPGGGWCNCSYYDGGYNKLQYNEGDGYVKGSDNLGDPVNEYAYSCLGEYQHYAGAPYYSGELCTPNRANKGTYHFYKSPGILLTPRVLKEANQCPNGLGCTYFIWGWESWY